ncbi:melanoma antigen preferentially expressed in tumors-like [Rattus norvegicus]|nr:melanoma antigen preferentially expressed in tumors-like [Rattus norvegicus]XP_579018.2 melanoma antigen preferentially expressed in tumors-like [Rattus norvegicus]|eukprot:XP_006232232.1 PREDICTED: melanoma antigen preferentially expressed in tumors-like [Rattus norvegicus]
MDTKEPRTLLDLAIQCLLSNEHLAIQALEEIPRELFVPLFTAAFTGKHKNTLTSMVKIWPFTCLHIGALSVQESQRELLKAMVESLQFLPAPNSASRCPKLRILDLRQDAGCKTTCPDIINKSTICFHSCAYSEHSIFKMELQENPSSPESEAQPSKVPMELLVDLSLDGTLRESDFFAFLLNKIKQSLGSLHLCCRDLQINNLCECRNSLRHLDLKCVDHLAVDQASLSEVTTLLSHVIQLDRLSLSKITCRSLNGRTFRNFITQLRRMDHLKELNLSSFCLTDHLESVLRVLPASLDFLYLPFCGLSYSDFKFLSECPQANHLKLLNISNNPMYWEDCEPFYHLLQNISGTLQHLAINHCLLTDSTISVLIPALTRCSYLRVFSFSSNPITMPMLMRILELLAPLMALKYVIYPIPVHCYGRWHFQGSLDRQKLMEVQTQLKLMLQEVERSDMNWITYSD